MRRDGDSPDYKKAGQEVFLNLFSANEVAGGTSKYQIAEQTVFNLEEDTPERRSDITLLINGIPVIHIELKASGIEISEATNQIKKYIQERKFQGFMGLIQVFWAITPEDAVYFANPGNAKKMNPAFFFHWGDRDNHMVRGWREIIDGESRILSIPEAHQLVGYYSVKNTFYNALFFGFTGTPIFPENMRAGEMTTESVFGRCLAVYSLATGIRDGNVLGFYPKGEKTYEDGELRMRVALDQSNSQSEEEAKKDPEKWKIYRNH